MTEKKLEKITTGIWNEVAEDDNPFAAAACYCAGYDVYGDLLGKASYVEYLYVLFKLERPTPSQARLLEGLAIALANPGPRDHSVRAAMCAGVGGSTHASALIGALSVGAGNLGGGREVYTATQYWQACGTDLAAWCTMIKEPPVEERTDVWVPMEHPPGFDPNGVSCPTPVRQTLEYLAEVGGVESLTWLQQNRPSLEAEAGLPLAMSGVAAAAMYCLGLSPEQSEMLYLLLRLPGAAVHSLEQEKLGWRKYPFFGDGLKIVDSPSIKSSEG
ncbi:MAG: citryl-CoA lyase [Gammaproteobacteria bacterium]|nr:MAG: citryl-CoA lyase [Gammaproteobacteria bacterium]